jgi:RNA polymerase-binding transcription factor DksA
MQATPPFGLDMNFWAKAIASAATPMLIGALIRLFTLEKNFNKRLTAVRNSIEERLERLEDRSKQVDSMAGSLAKIQESQSEQNTRLAILETMSPKIERIEKTVTELGKVGTKIDTFNELTLRRLEMLERQIHEK